jgi:feruloyl esterase
MTATRVAGNRVDMTRPLCVYPQLATYKGTGSTNDAANFVCK